MAQASNDPLLSHRSGVPRALGRPTLIAVVALVVLAAAGWSYLGLMVAGMTTMGPAEALGPGMGLLDRMIDGAGLGPFGRAVAEALCRPSFGTHAHAGAADIALVFAMWAAMALAMMLPTAGPMILTYAEIADTAALKGERIASPLTLAAGYVSVWLGFAAFAALAQMALTRAALLDPAMASASPLFSGAIFLGAGAYQFSALKHACVTRCQRPFPFFLAHWSSASRAVFRLGLRQGVYCLGCCWAMMLVMFAVGVMNVVWMAALGLIMAAEKIAVTTRFSRAIGVVFGVVGITLISTAVAAHWPGGVG